MPGKKMIDSKLKNQQGFSLVELLVVVFIVGLMSTIVFANYRISQRQFALQRSAHKLTQDIRRTQNMALAARVIGGGVPAGYGVYFISGTPTQYILFADNGDGLFGAGDTAVETLHLEGRITITGLSPASPLTIVFSPPDPSVLISGNPVNNLASITLNHQDGGVVARTVSVNRVGLIEVE